MPSPTMNAQTRREWRGLGFFYERDDAGKRWVVKGSKAGVLVFTKLLWEYGQNPKNDQVSEHAHYGPYSYLEFMTWSEPKFDRHAIQGRLPDFARLADLVEARLFVTGPRGGFDIGDEYSEKNEYILRVEVMDDGFDPASPDPHCRD